MGAGWVKNEVNAAKRRCDMIIIGDDGLPAPPGTDFMALGLVFITSSTAAKLDLAVGTMTNKRRPLVIADDVVEAVDTGDDTLQLTGHGYKTGDGPFDGDEVIGPGIIPAGSDFWLIRVDADNVAVAATLADAYTDTRVPLSGTETGMTISDILNVTERGIPGEFEYQATQPETNKDLAEQVVIVDGPGYQRELGCGAHTTVMMQTSTAADVWADPCEVGTRGDQMNIVSRSVAANFTRDVGGHFVVRDHADTKDSHESTVSPTGKTGANIIDAT